MEVADNLEHAAKAIEQYRIVLELKPSEIETISAVKGIAYLDLQMKKYDEARDYYHLATVIDPEDPEAYYSIGVIDWTITSQRRQEERTKLGLKPDASLPTKNPGVCATVRQSNWAHIEEGIDNLSKVLQLRPDYDDAMAYMNLMYRERADVECDNRQARRADLKIADDWIDKTMAAKKTKAEKEQLPGAPKN